MEERFASVFGDANDQVRKACDIIASDPKLAEGYNAVGFSQVLWREAGRSVLKYNKLHFTGQPVYASSGTALP